MSKIKNKPFKLNILSFYFHNKQRPMIRNTELTVQKKSFFPFLNTKSWPRESSKTSRNLNRNEHVNVQKI